MVNATTKNKITVAVGLQKPPYVIEKEHSGFEIELIRAILEIMGYQTEFVYVPFARSWRMLGVSGIDAVMTVTDKVIHDKEKLSDIYIHYQNVAITLKSKDHIYKIDEISDLRHYSVAAFQNAKKVLGNEFFQSTKLMPYYVEISDQKRQLKLLLQDKVEVVVMDKNIFNYFLAELDLKSKATGFIFHQIFPKSAYRMIFNNPAITQQFNRVLAYFLNSNDYQVLLKKYQFDL